MKYGIDINSLPVVAKPSAWKFVKTSNIIHSIGACAFWIPILFLIIKWVFGDWILSWLLYFFLIVLITVIANVFIAISNRNASYNGEISSNKYTANRSSKELISLLSQGEKECDDCGKLVKKIRFEIEVAREKYNKRFFAKFWDNVEKITQLLGEYHEQIQRISRIQTSYEYNLKQIESVKHNFPDTPLKMNIIPAVYRELNAFNEVIALGESDYEFASIWESRRTREVLIAGFKTLQESIDGIGNMIRSEFDLLNQRLN